MASLFITGGAAGIGLATAERCDREGWTVGVYDVDTDALAAVQAAHPTWITGALDVRDAEQWAPAARATCSATARESWWPAIWTRSRRRRSRRRSTSTCWA